MKLLYLFLVSCLVGNSFAMNPKDCYQQFKLCKEEAFNSAKDFNDFNKRRVECKIVFHECNYNKSQDTYEEYRKQTEREWEELSKELKVCINDPKYKKNHEKVIYKKSPGVIREGINIAVGGTLLYGYGYILYHVLGIIYGKK